MKRVLLRAQGARQLTVLSWKPRVVSLWVFIPFFHRKWLLVAPRRVARLLFGCLTQAPW